MEEWSLFRHYHWPAAGLQDPNFARILMHYFQSQDLRHHYHWQVGDQLPEMVQELSATQTSEPETHYRGLHFQDLLHHCCLPAADSWDSSSARKLKTLVYHSDLTLSLEGLLEQLDCHCWGSLESYRGHHFQSQRYRGPNCLDQSSLG